MQLLEDAGCRIKRGAQISIKPPDGNRFVRMDILGSEYTEAALRSTISCNCVHIPKVPRGRLMQSQVQLLIDIEAKMAAGKGKGYQRWAQRHNTDAMAQSMIYLKDNHIDSIEEPEDMIASGTKERNAANDRIREAQKRMKEVSEQQKAIRIYRRTKETYAQYKASNWSPKFYREHKAEIDQHKEAAMVYERANGQLPKLADLSAEYDCLLEQKRADCALLSQRKAELSNLWHIKTNFDILMDDQLPDRIDPQYEPNIDETRNQTTEHNRG